MPDPGVGDDSGTSLDIRPWRRLTLEQALISDPGEGLTLEQALISDPGEGLTLEPALISDPGGGDDSRTSLDIRPWGRG